MGSSGYQLQHTIRLLACFGHTLADFLHQGQAALSLFSDAAGDLE
jgi:hypothetical protein